MLHFFPNIVFLILTVRVRIRVTIKCIKFSESDKEWRLTYFMCSVFEALNNSYKCHFLSALYD